MTDHDTKIAHHLGVILKSIGQIEGISLAMRNIIWDGLGDGVLTSDLSARLAAALDKVSGHALDCMHLLGEQESVLEETLDDHS